MTVDLDFLRDALLVAAHTNGRWGVWASRLYSKERRNPDTLVLPAEQIIMSKEFWIINEMPQWQEEETWAFLDVDYFINFHAEDLSTSEMPEIPVKDITFGFFTSGRVYPGHGTEVIACA